MVVIAGGKVAIMIVVGSLNTGGAGNTITTFQVLLVPLDQEIVTKTDHHTMHCAIL